MAKKKTTAMQRLVRSKSQMAYAVVRRGVVDLTRVEPFTDEGHADLVRSINRPAGESVKAIGLTILD